jgi:hypothetical protein
VAAGLHRGAGRHGRQPAPQPGGEGAATGRSVGRGAPGAQGGTLRPLRRHGLPGVQGRPSHGSPTRPAHVKEQSIVVGIDPGIRWTGVCFVAFDDENFALVFDELYLKQKTVPEVAERSKALRHWGVTPDFYVIDPSRVTARRSTRTPWRPSSSGTAFSPSTVRTTVESGILTIKRDFKANPLRCCLNGVQGTDLRVRPLPDRPEGATDQFAVVKVDDHVLDAMRYALMTRLGRLQGARPRKRGAATTRATTFEPVRSPGRRLARAPGSP